MSVHSVSCWRGLDKAGALLAGIDPAISLISMSLNHAIGLDTVLDAVEAPGSGQEKLTALPSQKPLAQSTFKDTHSTFKDTHLALKTPGLSFKRARLLAERGAHLWENWALTFGRSRRVLGIGAMLFQPEKQHFGAVIRMRIRTSHGCSPSGELGAHFRENCRSPSGEVALTFGRTKSKQLVDYEAVISPQLF